jgi:hypothetical protein
MVVLDFAAPPLEERALESFPLSTRELPPEGALLEERGAVLEAPLVVFCPFLLETIGPDMPVTIKKIFNYQFFLYK